MAQPRPWVEEVVDALRDLGGEATEQQLEERVRRRGIMNLTPTPGRTINATLTSNSSDSTRHGPAGPRRDLFERVSSGRWRLRQGAEVESLRRWPSSDEHDEVQVTGADVVVPVQDRGLDELIAKALDELERRGEFDPADDLDARERIARNIAARLGQSQFRERLMEAYEARCAVTGCDVRAVLEAAHIKPYRGEKSNHVRNGLLLRADIHTLFDRGLLTLVPEDEGIRVELNPALRDGPYAELHGQPLRRPTHPDFAPDPKALSGSSS